MTEAEKHYYEVASEGGVAVLGKMTQQEAEGIAQVCLAWALDWR
jgi:hypothetical protein